jgi:hypothetical protein
MEQWNCGATGHLDSAGGVSIIERTWEGNNTDAK